MFRLSFHFGLFQGAMPVLGWAGVVGGVLLIAVGLRIVVAHLLG
jgi:putative Mn2+ efflux pump MntP